LIFDYHFVLFFYWSFFFFFEKLLSQEAGMASKSFDYVIIGGGTAGLTIASRIAEDKQVTVAVIEAGINYQIAAPFLSTIPAADVAFVGAKESLQTIDWGQFLQVFVSASRPSQALR
jgi:hypothetical protein